MPIFTKLPFLKNISNPDVTDLELVEAYRKGGDIRVLGSLYQRYMDLVYGVCLKYLEDSESAKDAVMQIFEELVNKLLKHDVLNFKSWLYTLAKNYCLMQLRSGKNRKTVEINPSVMQSEADVHLNGVMQKEGHIQLME